MANAFAIYGLIPRARLMRSADDGSMVEGIIGPRLPTLIRVETSAERAQAFAKGMEERWGYSWMLVKPVAGEPTFYPSHGDYQ